MTRQPPPVSALSYAQYSGWACCWCHAPLRTGAVSAGRARGQEGAHVLDIEVYACPNCAKPEGQKASHPINPAVHESGSRP